MDGMENRERMDGDSCLRLAYQAIFHGDFDSAVHWFAQAVEQEPDNASYYYKASITCARSGKTALAEKYACMAAELEPEDPVYALNLNAIVAKRQIAEGKALLEQPEPATARALGILREAEERDPLSAEAKILLAEACRMQGDWHEAIRYLREALALEPQHDEASRLLREWKSELRRRFRPHPSSFKPYRNR
jgi:Flp pilus assembly protein TadD